MVRARAALAATLALAALLLARCSASATTAAELLDAWPTRFGRVQSKSGFLNPTHFGQQFSPDAVLRWIFDRAVHVDLRGSGGHPRTFPHPAPCLVYRNRRINTLLIVPPTELWLLEGLGNACRKGKKEGRQAGPQCFERWRGEDDPAEYARVWAASTVITAAPNVLVHAARAYQLIPSRWANADDKCAPLPFAAFAADPPALAVQGGVFRCHGKDAPGPGVFADLAAIQPLTACVAANGTGGGGSFGSASSSGGGSSFGAGGGLAVDFIVRSHPNHMLADMRDAVALIRERLAVAIATAAADGPAGSGTSSSSGASGGAPEVLLEEAVVNAHAETMRKTAASQYAALYDTCSEGCRKALVDYYRADLELLGVEGKGA